jgi:hypothetical protein
MQHRVRPRLERHRLVEFAIIRRRGSTRAIENVCAVPASSARTFGKRAFVRRQATETADAARAAADRSKLFELP